MRARVQLSANRVSINEMEGRYMIPTDYERNDIGILLGFVAY